MNPRPQTGADAAAAGAVLITVLIVCAAAGYGVGSLFGSATLLAALGLLVGFILGIAVVYIRFRGT